MSYHLQLFVFQHCLEIRFSLMSLGSRTCPKGLNPAAAIAKIKLELAAD